jgi:hypothetical protein
MGTAWRNPLTEARPPSRPTGVDWLAAWPWLCLAAFWLAVIILAAYLLGAF